MIKMLFDKPVIIDVRPGIPARVRSAPGLGFARRGGAVGWPGQSPRTPGVEAPADSPGARGLCPGYPNIPAPLLAKGGRPGSFGARDGVALAVVRPGDRGDRTTGLRQELASVGARRFLLRSALISQDFGPYPGAAFVDPVTGLGFGRRGGIGFGRRRRAGFVRRIDGPVEPVSSATGWSLAAYLLIRQHLA